MIVLNQIGVNSDTYFLLIFAFIEQPVQLFLKNDTFTASSLEAQWAIL